MEKGPHLWQVDSETFDDIGECIGDFCKYLHWLVETRQIENLAKVRPIVVRLNSLILAIWEGRFPEMGEVHDTLNRFTDEVNEKITQCKTLDDFEQLEKQIDESVRQIEESCDRAARLMSKKEKSH